MKLSGDKLDRNRTLFIHRDEKETLKHNFYQQQQKQEKRELFHFHKSSAESEMKALGELQKHVLSLVHFPVLLCYFPDAFAVLREHFP